MKANVNTNDILSTLGTGKKKSKGKTQILILTLACVLIAGFLGVKLENEKAPVFTTVDAIQGDITVQVSATGTLEPTNEIDVGSELSGTIQEVYVDFNSRVKTGQILARIDTTKLEAQVVQYGAALKAAEAKVLEMKATEKETLLKLNQIKKLWELTEHKSPSQQEVDAAEAAYTRAVADTVSADASVIQAQANLKSIETDLSKAIIRSPVDGIVLNKEIKAGQTVAASYETPTLFTIAEDLKKMELHVDVDEADIGQVEEGQNVAFTVDAHPGKIFKGIITQTRYGSTTTDNVVTYETVIQVDNSDLVLRPGMTATADIIVNEIKNVIKIPKIALRYSPSPVVEEKESLLRRLMPGPPRMNKARQQVKKDGTVTMWVQKNGIPEPVDIILGETDGEFKQLVSGDIKAGDKLITGQTNGNQS